MPRAHVMSLAIGVLAVGLLAGCSADPSPEPTDSAPTPELPVVDVTDPACLVGSWSASSSQIAAFYDDVNESLGGAVVFDPDGTATLEIRGDDTFAWRPSMVLDADLAGTPARITFGGEISGRLTTGPGTIRTTEDFTDGLVVGAEVAGQPTDPSLVTDEILESPLTEATFACTPDALTLTTRIGLADATLTLDRA